MDFSFSSEYNEAIKDRSSLIFKIVLKNYFGS